MKACWHQDRIKNRHQLRKADFSTDTEKQMNLGYGVEVGSQNQAKIH